jgi:uncharacterized membrane protein
MLKIKQFFSTTFLGGFLIVLPLVILFLVFRSLFLFILNNIDPITGLVIKTTMVNRPLAAIITIGIILGTCFFLGLFIKTTFGRFIYVSLENNLLFKIPGYRIVKETVSQLLGSQKNLFSGVALVDLFGSKTMVTAFITDRQQDGSVTVFIPSAPAPTAGFIYHVKKENYFEIDYPVDLAMKSILSFGAGSQHLYDTYLNQQKEPDKRE